MSNADVILTFARYEPRVFGQYSCEAMKHSFASGNYLPCTKRSILLPKAKRKVFLAVAMIATAFTAVARATDVCQDGCFYSNTYQGDNALIDFGAGGNNSAFGIQALFSSDGGTDNTALGAFTLYGNGYYSNTASYNTAVGSIALNRNDTGNNNTAVGYSALSSNVWGSYLTAVGSQALFHYTGYYAESGWPPFIGPTAIGYQALYNDTGYLEADSHNTAIGFESLYNTNERYVDWNNWLGNDNTGVGFDSLLSNYDGGWNTAIGSQALFRNVSGFYNTAIGSQALYSSTATSNTAIGSSALFSATTGASNTATGAGSLYDMTTGTANTAHGAYALTSNNGSNNTAIGAFAINPTFTFTPYTGSNNTADGAYALQTVTNGSNNTAIGYLTLSSNTTGSSNIALGDSAGSLLTTGKNNIDIGNVGNAGESSKIRIGTTGTQKATFIAGISGVTVPSGVGVIVGTDGKLGTVVSSARFKEQVRPMDKASESILALEPVTFRYKYELDPAGIPQFGLVAEEVEKVDPDLVVRDDECKPFSVRYDAINAMLLNEFLKEHRQVANQTDHLKAQNDKIHTLEATVAELKSLCQTQAAQMRQVSARVEAIQSTRRLATNP